jgi:hypothetical protein
MRNCASGVWSCGPSRNDDEETKRGCRAYFFKYLAKKAMLRGQAISALALS